MTLDEVRGHCRRELPKVPAYEAVSGRESRIVKDLERIAWLLDRLRDFMDATFPDGTGDPAGIRAARAATLGNQVGGAP